MERQAEHVLSELEMRNMIESNMRSEKERLQSIPETYNCFHNGEAGRKNVCETIAVPWSRLIRMKASAMRVELLMIDKCVGPVT